MNDIPKTFNLSCPIPKSGHESIQLADGGGGRAMARLLDDCIKPALMNDWLASGHDGAVFNTTEGRMAFTTDSYVVRPLFFPGGDIGSLAVNGTVNDLAMCGAKPLFLSLGLILEEGFPKADLEKIMQSIREAARAASVHIVTGDTKVVDHGKGDGIYMNTAGVGQLLHDQRIGPERIQAGDGILLWGDLGRHGMAIMAKREGLEFESPIQSDCAPLHKPVQALLDAKVPVHCFRDLTRGGLASGLNELASQADRTIVVEEKSIPVTEPVYGACEILGFDPFYVANEGAFITILPGASVSKAMDILENISGDIPVTQIGEVTDAKQTMAPVILKSRIGSERVLDMLHGEQLPRIC